MLQKFNACDEVTPMNVEDDAETALVKVLDETYVTEVGDPSLRDVDVSGKNHGPVDLNIFLFFWILLLQARLYNPTSELFAFESLLSISLSILASVEIVQPK